MLCIFLLVYHVLFVSDTFGVFLRNGAVMQHRLIKIHFKPFNFLCDFCGGRRGVREGGRGILPWQEHWALEGQLFVPLRPKDQSSGGWPHPVAKVTQVRARDSTRYLRMGGGGCCPTRADGPEGSGCPH